MIPEGKKPTQYDYDKLFLAYEEARSDITSHFRKILELQKENEFLMQNVITLVSKVEQLDKTCHLLEKELERCKEIAERDAKDYAAMKAKLEKAKEALEFYASKGIWGSGYSNDYGSNPMMLNVNDHDYEVIVDNDELIGGKLARQTLKEIEDMK